MDIGFAVRPAGGMSRDPVTGRFSGKAVEACLGPCVAESAAFSERMKAALADVLQGRPVDGSQSFSRAACLWGADVALVLERRSAGEIRALAVAFRVIAEGISEIRESDRLIAIAMRAFGVTRNEIMSYRRSRRIVMARHFVIHWLFRRTPMSSTMIGRRIGGRDHTTALHARDKWAGKRMEARAIRRAISLGQPIGDMERQARANCKRRLVAYAGREQRA